MMADLRISMTDGEKPKTRQVLVGTKSAQAPRGDQRPMPVQEIMRLIPFQIGFHEARGKKRFEPDRFRGPGDQWLYERGRQLAVIYSGPLDGPDGPNGLARAAFTTYVEARAKRIIP